MAAVLVHGGSGRRPLDADLDSIFLHHRRHHIFAALFPGFLRPCLFGFFGGLRRPALLLLVSELRSSSMSYAELALLPNARRGDLLRLIRFIEIFRLLSASVRPVPRLFLIVLETVR